MVDFWAFLAKIRHFVEFWIKNGEILRNVVFGGEAVKMAKKQHIGNFQI